MSRLVQADEQASVSQITTRYSRAEQESIPECTAYQISWRMGFTEQSCMGTRSQNWTGEERKERSSINLQAEPSSVQSGHHFYTHDGTVFIWTFPPWNFSFVVLFNFLPESWPRPLD